jgi:hypothetical protein
VLSTSGKASAEEVDYKMVDDVLPGNIKLDFVYIGANALKIPTLLGMQAVIKKSPRLAIMVDWDYDKEPVTNKNKFKAL